MHKKVLIISAGLAGPILALQLKKIGFDVEIFEARSEHNTKCLFTKNILALFVIENFKLNGN
ncbi:hypothetical protein BWD42_05475 [Sphingobacterium sp. CZ-UAM]|nr:hypothetical protein BWD42_05475 [Sphingobacterium sp. CZ-UAM]